MMRSSVSFCFDSSSRSAAPAGPAERPGMTEAGPVRALTTLNGRASGEIWPMVVSLGLSDLEVGVPLALGANPFSWTADEATSHAVLDAFVAGGGTLIDTSDSYGWRPGGQRGEESERIIGSWSGSRPHAAALKPVLWLWLASRAILMLAG